MEIFVYDVLHRLLNRVRFHRYRFTGKERDKESGNDYFEARYYSSAMGRFMSPDWAAQEEPVPYANLDDPQTLNLYAYVQNNPMTQIDSDGHDGDNPFYYNPESGDPFALPPSLRLPAKYQLPEKYQLTPEKLQRASDELGDEITSFVQK